MGWEGSAVNPVHSILSIAIRFLLLDSFLSAVILITMSPEILILSMENLSGSELYVSISKVPTLVSFM